MDVQDLAPALLALGHIIQTANQKFNGDAAAIRVLVNADIEQRCFQIDISLVQSIIEHTRTLFASDAIKTAEDIAKFVGITAGATVSLFKLAKWLGGRPEGAGTTLTTKAGDGSTVIIVNGDGNSITVPREVHELAADQSVWEDMKGVARPLTKRGYDSLSFLEGETKAESLTSYEAQALLAVPPNVLTAVPTESESMIRGPVRIKTPQYEGSAKWAVMWAGRAIEVTMPPEWVRQFQTNAIKAPPGTVLYVEMRQVALLDDKGAAAGSPSYVVTEIDRVVLPDESKQGDLLPPPSA